MRRIAIGAAAIGIAALIARLLAPKLHARLQAGCERMFEQMPDEFPPKRMLGGIEEIRASTARTLELLEQRGVGAAESLGGASVPDSVHHTPSKRPREVAFIQAT